MYYVQVFDRTTTVSGRLLDPPTVCHIKVEESCSMVSSRVHQKNYLLFSALSFLCLIPNRRSVNNHITCNVCGKTGLEN